VSATDRVALAKLPLPASLTAADEDALITRLNLLLNGQLPVAQLDGAGLQAAAATLKHHAQQLQANGWVTILDGFNKALPALSKSLAGPSASGAAQSAAVQPLATSGTAPITLVPGLYWKLTDAYSGFETRGKFATSQTTFTNTFLAPNTLYQVEYV